MLILSMIGMAIGLILLVGGFGLLLYGIWLRYWVEPSRRAAAPDSAADGQSGAARQ